MLSSCHNTNCIWHKRYLKLPAPASTCSPGCTAITTGLNQPRDQRERWWYNAGFDSVIGVDEVGRGCIAGPVVAAAVMLDIPQLNQLPHHHVQLICDSKSLKEKQRNTAAHLIKKICRGYAIASIKPHIIDQIGIHQASIKAMQQATIKLARTCNFSQPHHSTTEYFSDILVCIDGRFPLNLADEFSANCHNRHHREIAIIKGDQELLCIGAASIIAKAHRDSAIKRMERLFPQYAGYGFSSHVGYPTPAHKNALQRRGVSAIHRRSYAPVKSLLNI
ncbi:MAG: ribonuclease HII [Proteobacteria bacterium]|nr:ribonuclease HII [Pseudomonadota bacterium]